MTQSARTSATQAAKHTPLNKFTVPKMIYGSQNTFTEQELEVVFGATDRNTN